MEQTLDHIGGSKCWDHDIMIFWETGKRGQGKGPHLTQPFFFPWKPCLRSVGSAPAHQANKTAYYRILAKMEV